VWDFALLDRSFHRASEWERTLAAERGRVGRAGESHDWKTSRRVECEAYQYSIGGTVGPLRISTSGGGSERRWQGKVKGRRGTSRDSGGKSWGASSYFLGGKGCSEVIQRNRIEAVGRRRSVASRYEILVSQ